MEMSKAEFDRQFLSQGLLCGVDEAGRGCLAGPVVAAAVVYDVTRLPDISVDDSKRLSPEMREALFAEILKTAVDYAVGVASWKKIDEMNIREASRYAMLKAVKNLKIKPEVVLVDGNISLEVSERCYSIVKGDAKSFVVGCASIVAKVVRDRLMVRYHRLFPHYAFDKHKGYPTKQHRESIKRFGVSPIHRLSFRLGV